MSEKRATQAETEVLRDQLLAQGFTMAQVRRAVRALLPGALSFTEAQIHDDMRIPFLRTVLREQRARDRGAEYKGDRAGATPFPRPRR